VGVKQGANIMTEIMTTFGERISENIAIIYYITEFKHSKFQYFGILLYGWAVGIKECFSYDKIKK
jgi:hypothetical protein